MMWAWGQPWVKSTFENLERPGNEQQSSMVKGSVVAVGGLFLYFWFTRIFLLPKFDYNQLHPYYSAIPIIYYILMRNLMPTWRKWHLGLLEQAGKITLETSVASAPCAPTARAAPLGGLPTPRPECTPRRSPCHPHAQSRSR